MNEIVSTNKPIIGTGNTDDYELISRIGSGRYGEVFEAVNVTNNKKVAIKVLKPIRREKVIREIEVLRYLNGGQNVITLKDIVINNGIPSLIFPFISRDTLKTLGPYLSEFEVHYYLLRLLRAIDFCHSKKIIHRDIKPSNVVIDTNRRLLRLVDWGLADFHVHNKVYSVTVASRHYKSPEILCNYPTYDYSLDIWSFGCCLAALVFKREPFFQGIDNMDQLMKICSVLGTQCLRDFLKKYNLSKIGFNFILSSNFQRRNWNDFTPEGNQGLVNSMAIDLIDKLLVFDHKHRLTADETISHPFFDGFDQKFN